MREGRIGIRRLCSGREEIDDRGGMEVFLIFFFWLLTFSSGHVIFATVKIKLT